jgi:hypothetical protein
MGINIRPDVSTDGNPWCHPDCINSSAPTYLVLRMVSLWGDNCREGNEPGYVYHSELKTSNDYLPWTLQAYLKQECKNLCISEDEYSRSWEEPVTQEMFDEARSFIRKCAIEHWSAIYA